MFDGEKYFCDGLDYPRIQGTTKLREVYCRSFAKWKIQTKWNVLHICDKHKIKNGIKPASFAQWEEIK